MPDAKPATAHYDIEAMRKDGYSDTNILKALHGEFSTKYDIEAMRKAGHSDTSILNAIAPDFTPPAQAVPIGKQASANPFDQFDTQNAKVDQFGGVLIDGSLPQPDNSHTLAWGAGIAVFVAVALLAWFKFRKTETVSGAGTAAQSHIYEQKENSYAEKEPHSLQMGATKGNAMSQNQKRILIAVLALVAAMFVYPPFQIIANNGTAFNMGYGWIFDSPKRGSIIANVNVPMLLIQWVGVLIVGGIAFFLAKSSSQEPRDSGSNVKAENSSHMQPDPMLGTKLEKLQSAKKLFFILLSIDIAVTVIDIGSGIWSIGALKDVASGVRTADPSLASIIDFWGSFSMIMVLTTIGVGLGLVKWLKSCYQFAKESLHATGFKQEGWTVAGWIIPIVFLFKPYQVINEIYRAGSPTYSDGDDWKKESGSGLLLTWWIFWAVTHFLMITIGKEMFKKTLLHDLTIPQIIGAYEVQAWSCAISIVIAGLWFAVAHHLTQRLVGRSSRYAPKPSFPDSTKASPISSAQRTVQNAPTIVQHAPAVANADTVRTPPTEAKPAMNSQPAVNAMPDIAIESSQQSMPEIEDRLYEQIAQEIETNAVDKGIWTKAFAQSGGDDKLTRVAYIKARFEKLMVTENANLEVLQREREEVARLEQEQLEREREKSKHTEKLRQRISLRELSKPESDKVKDLEVSDDSFSFFARCSGGDLDFLTTLIMINPLFLLVRNGSGSTGLHMAVMNKHTDVAKFLAEEGASVSVPNGDGKSPIDLAKESGQTDLAVFFQQFSVA